MNYTKLSAEVDFIFGGYLFNLSSYSKTYDNKLFGLIDIPGVESSTDLLRARFRPKLLLGDNSRFEAQYEINGLISNRNLFVLTEISENKRQLVKLARNIHTDEHTILNHYIDRLYFKQNFDFAEITIGRQRISWGVGRVWQPTDLFNPLNPANFSKIEKDGADAISSKIYISNFTDLEIVYNPTMSQYSNNYGARFRTNLEQYDLSAIFGNFDNRNVLGAEFAGNLLDAGFRGEALYSFKGGNMQNEYLKFILGLDYQFSDRIYGLIEYQHNGEGNTEKEKYEFLRLANGEILNVAQNYLALNCGYKFDDLTNFSITNNLNLDDLSGLVSFAGLYQYAQALQFNLALMLTYGNQGTEYRFYPVSLYLITEYYF
jgi:hypothetical protein